MQRPRVPCSICHKQFINLKSHLRKTHDVFTFIVQNDTHTLHKNNEQIAIFNRVADGCRNGTNYTVYESMDNLPDKYYTLHMYIDNTFEVLNHSGVIIVGRRCRQ
jgi:hypothetical protein